MNIRELAQELIEALKADLTERNLEGTISVLESFEESIHSGWEQHLLKETNEWLMIDNHCCRYCGCAVQIERKRECAIVYDK